MYLSLQQLCYPHCKNGKLRHRGLCDLPMITPSLWLSWELNPCLPSPRLALCHPLALIYIPPQELATTQTLFHISWRSSQSSYWLQPTSISSVSALPFENMGLGSDLQLSQPHAGYFLSSACVALPALPSPAAGSLRCSSWWCRTE